MSVRRCSTAVVVVVVVVAIVDAMGSVVTEPNEKREKTKLEHLREAGCREAGRLDSPK